jgi:hypothetical protein
MPSEHSLNEEARLRFARHLLLREIGLAGQARLCAARVCIAPEADGSAGEAARDYLVRSGLTVVDTRGGAARQVAVADHGRVRALAGAPDLEPAAAGLAGAFAAVETIKAVLGVGDPAELPPALVLAAPGEP